MKTLVLISMVLVEIICTGSCSKLTVKRSIDLAASHSLIADPRLSKDVIPLNYDLVLYPDMDENNFSGCIKMNLSWKEDTNKISLHAHQDLAINESKITLTAYKHVLSEDYTQNIRILRTDRLPRKSILVIFLNEKLKQGTECELKIDFIGEIYDRTEGLFKGSYVTRRNEKENYLATFMRPHNARRLFPCYDEPAFKVPFTVSIGRQRHFSTLFNTKIRYSENISDDYAVDHFETTPPMATFTFGFVTSKLNKIPKEQNTFSPSAPTITLWSPSNRSQELNRIYSKLYSIYDHLEAYFNASLPLSKIDVIFLPDLPSMRPADNWGLLVFKESDLEKNGYYSLTQELIYQWLGAWVTPYWWSDAHVNKALASFIAADLTFEIDNGSEFNGKYPMTILYSLYYEFSKRYPHSRITAMKQETISFKTELVIRMLNYTLGKDIFRLGIQAFIANKHYKTFFGDDLWDALTKVAHTNGRLNSLYDVSEIAGSWVTKDRLPVVNVIRNYDDRSATISQKVYLRERPHDVPEQDKMLWWIPIIIIEQQNLSFKNATLCNWLEKKHQIILRELPTKENFIVVNPEEIGPFPVNYDLHNWNLLSQFLQTDEGRKLIPTYTRAKLLHDAWNLAYAGDLNFAVAFNMTLFMKYERNHIVWNPVFTFIDHIGRHIDMSPVHRKFEMYVRALLTPLFEEMEPAKVDEEGWRIDLRNLAKTFLCRAGYRACIEEAQQMFKMWMDLDDPDKECPVPNQYMCPVFKWGSMKEWEFGLARVMNFPKTRIRSERTFLLKTLSGCPIQQSKIEHLLNTSIFHPNSNFSDNDISLIFRMLTGGSTGYKALFNFLTENWSSLKNQFQNKTNLWDSLIGSATGVFTTQDGLDLVKDLHRQHAGEFGSAEHIIEKSIRNIKEESKWTDENLPIIEKWLDHFLATTNQSNSKFIE